MNKTLSMKFNQTSTMLRVKPMLRVRQHLLRKSSQLMPKVQS